MRRVRSTSQVTMAVKLKLSLGILLLSSLLLCAGLALATTDPELKQCRHQCKVQRQYGEEEKQKCLQRCEDYHREKKERECERREGEGKEEERRRRRDDEWVVAVDPEKKLRQCQQQCEKQEGQQRSLCRLRCQQRYERERERGGGEEEEEEEEGHYRREKEEEEEERGSNPYVFGDQHFTSRVRTQHGRIDVLQKFTKKSKLLRGIENYRVAILEANPRTFISPSHWDADGVLFVAQGRGTITMIREEKRESYNIECGDVVRVHAGNPVYLINRDENEKLVIVKLLRPVNIPGEFEAFHAAGGEEPESFYRAFSWELLEAALKTDRRKLEQILKQRQGVIVKASEEQIQAMSRREEGGGIWPFGDEERGPFNLLHKRPVHSNNYGQLFEANPRDYKQQLHDLDLAISFANITRGSMIGPYYSSKSTKIGVVLDGEGHFEMACPHLSSGGRRSRSERGPRYEKISSDLSTGTVFIVPAGHPMATVASGNRNLLIVCFEVNAQGSTRYPLAGRNNVVNKLEREAKELAFGVRAREVEQVFGNQNEELFFPGPGGQQRRGHADA